MAKKSRKTSHVPAIIETTSDETLFQDAVTELHMGEPVENMAIDDALLADLEIAESEIVAEPTVPEPVMKAPSPSQVVLTNVTEPDIDNAESFADKLNAIAQDAVLAFASEIAKAIDERIDLAAKKGRPVKNFESARKKLVMPSVARVLMACNSGLDFIQREIHTGEKFNVYGLGKLADVANALAVGAVGNAINNAIIRSMINCLRARVPFTHEMAKAACSKNQPIDFLQAQYLVRHTVSPSTSSTQASSTMHALRALNLIVATGSAKNPIYEFAVCAQAKRLKEVVSAG